MRRRVEGGGEYLNSSVVVERGIGQEPGLVEELPEPAVVVAAAAAAWSFSVEVAGEAASGTRSLRWAQCERQTPAMQRTRTVKAVSQTRLSATVQATFSPRAHRRLPS